MEKMGAPRIRPDAVLTNRVIGVIAPDEHLRIKGKAHDLGLTVSQFVRYSVLEICDDMDGV